MNDIAVDGFIANIENTAKAAVLSLARRVFDEMVIPFCKERHCKFWSGMGIYSFEHQDDSHNHSKYDSTVNTALIFDEQWLRLRKILDVSVDIFKGTSFGALMWDYSPESIT